MSTTLTNRDPVDTLANNSPKLWEDRLNLAEIKILNTILNERSACPVQSIIERSSLARTEVYDRLNHLIYKRVVWKNIDKSLGIVVYGLTEDGHATITRFNKERGTK